MCFQLHFYKHSILLPKQPVNHGGSFSLWILLFAHLCSPSSQSKLIQTQSLPILSPFLSRTPPQFTILHTDSAHTTHGEFSHHVQITQVLKSSLSEIYIQIVCKVAGA